MSQSVPLQFDLSPDDQGLFLAELDELLQRVEQALVELEGAPEDPRLLQEIFRAAHTIKGSSATIGHTRMAALTHAMETRLDDIRKGLAPVTTQLIEALLQALDILKLLRDEVETREPALVDVDAAAAAVERRIGNRQPSATQPAVTTQAVPGDATHRVDVHLEPGPWATVRALQVLLALDEKVQVLTSEPSRQDLEWEDASVTSVLVTYVRTDEAESEIHRALERVPELGSVTIDKLVAPPVVVDESSAATARPAGPPETSRTTTGSKTVRIDVERLDALLNLVGELVIDRTRLVQLGGRLAAEFGDQGSVADLQQVAQHIGRMTDELQEHVMKSRMLPIETVFNRLPRVARDTAVKLGKQVSFSLEGKDTELDRSVIEEIGDPLMHLVRNAVDHGIETPEQRRAAGKPESGTARLSARQAESYILITMQDDGHGIDVAAVKRKAVERGVIGQEQADRMTDQEAARLVFAPGLSTAQAVSDISGRGVGLDVVKTNVEKLNGSIDVHSVYGAGTTFTIRLPLTLAILQALLVRVAETIYALPLHAVTETLRVESADVQRLHFGQAIQLRGTVLPLLPLRRTFGAPDADPASRRHVVAVRVGTQQMGLVVDALMGEQELVIKPLGGLVGDVAGLSGAAILGDGRVALIVDVPTLVKVAIDTDAALVARNGGEHARAA